MPEYPDITVYVEALEARILHRRLEGIRLNSPFLLRSVDPRPEAFAGRQVVALRRLGKRIAIGVEGELWAVLHLMIAGRLHWKPAVAGKPAPKLAGKNALAAFDFDNGSLTLTEAGSKRRASLHLAEGAAARDALNPGGLEIYEASEAQFAAALKAENHTLKRSLTDPHLFSGIGNAYSDEILHRARLSPVLLTQRLTDEQIARLYQATRASLEEWTARLRAEAAGGFPEKVTAFRPEMAVHGKFGEPCPVCGAKIQRIRYAENETDYCPGCQTEGRLLADRGLSRLLKQDWPRTPEELELRKRGQPIATSPAKATRR
jgi:formamidopyrimidine-DNA glycosylase